ncbi:helix-turn-helix domain-containing protein [Ekhidna sp.]|uniref:helix-turn-helix domain-containing protein n=1 Tax=Ekhidna sp. TaxID=2608089 RepID=UPI003C7CB5DA
MHNKETFGEIIRNLRELQGLPIRKVAAHLDIDPSTLSKIERGDRNANRDQVVKLSSILNIDEKSLMIDFLSDKVARELLYEEHSKEVLLAAEDKINYVRSTNVKQSRIDFE